MELVGSSDKLWIQLNFTGIDNVTTKRNGGIREHYLVV
jgi:hypothetical protein